MFFKVKAAHAAHRIPFGWFIVGLSVGAEIALLLVH